MTNSALVCLSPTMSGTGDERPIFLDPSGRRARAARRLGRAAGALAVLWVGATASALGTGSALPALPVQARASIPAPVAPVGPALAGGRRPLHWARIHTASGTGPHPGVAASVSG